jgi:predicted component of type VI protein secretion system
MKELPYVLRILAGSTPGVELPLKAFAREVVIGRSDEADVVLDDAQVSRRHARLFVEGASLLIEDLGSRNGVLVNARRITAPTALNEKDRIQLGTSLLRLGLPRGPDPSREDATAAFEPESEPAAPPARRDPSRFSGTIDEIPLPDLVQLLATGRKSGIVQVQGLQGFGRLYLREGRIVAAALGEPPKVRGPKAAYRMLFWQMGAFELHPPVDGMPEGEIDEPVDALLLEAMRQADEIARLQQSLPARNVRLVATAPAAEGLGGEPAELLRLVRETPRISVGKLLDASSLPDLETYEALLQLSRAGAVNVTQDW